MYICIGTNYCAGTGKTLDEAFKEYKNCHDFDGFEDCDFYKAEKIQVEIKIQHVETINKTSKTHD